VSAREEPEAPSDHRRLAWLLRRRRVLIWAVVIGAAAMVVWAVPETLRLLPQAPPGFWAMAAGALVVDVPLFGLLRRDDLQPRSTLSVCFTIAIYVLFGVAPAVVVQAIAGLVTMVGQRYRSPAGLYFVARLVWATFVADTALELVTPGRITSVGVGLNGGDLLAFVALTAMWFAVNYGLLVLARSAVSPGGFRQAASEVRGDLLRTAAAVTVVSPLLTTITSWWKVLLVVPLAIWNRLTREEAQQQAQLVREPVTGLLNRRGLDFGTSAITRLDVGSSGRPRPFGIIVVSSDALFAINRTLGREVYERVTAVVSQRFLDAYGHDRVALLSGEGVVILAPDLTEETAVVEARAAVAVAAGRIEVDGIPFSLDPAAGVSLSPQHGRELTTLLMKAELAVQEAHRSGLPAVLYVRRAAELARRRVEILRELRTVLDDPARTGEIAVLYQPQVELDSGRLAGVEALLRWTHPQWGPVSTDELVEAIEPSEVMHMLTRHMILAVTGQLRRWKDQGFVARAAVNVSVQDLHDPDFVDELAQTIQRQGIEPAQLTIEITERMVITDAERITHVAAELVRLGVDLSLDDFGTGYASLQQLRRLPLTEVKVDRSYIANLTENDADLAIVTSVHELAKTLGVSVVAEGVEDRRTAQALGRLPGIIGQGYYFGRPMTAEALRDWRYTPEVDESPS